MGPSYLLFWIIRLYVTAILFACCYVTRWGKFGRVFCKQTNVAACRFQNECNKVEIALRVVQFWSEIKLVITNRTPASRSCDFVIMRLISDQIALHSVQLPLLNELSNAISPRPVGDQVAVESEVQRTFRSTTGQESTSNQSSVPNPPLATINSSCERPTGSFYQTLQLFTSIVD